METLHSTMFPINLIRIVGAIQLNHLYIPLCFLLIQVHKERQAAQDRLYIPLCFLLIRNQRRTVQRHSLLYIPLCFLLIHAGLGLDIAVVVSLHSTMFPINRDAPDEGEGL